MFYQLVQLFLLGFTWLTWQCDWKLIIIDLMWLTFGKVKTLANQFIGFTGQPINLISTTVNSKNVNQYSS